MLNKLLISVYIPSLDITLEFFIPINKKIGTIKKTIIELLASSYSINEQEIQKLSFFDRDSGNLIEEYSFVYDSSIKNGTRLLLI